MFKRIKTWFLKHRKGVLITATILAITGTIVILLINGKKVKMPVLYDLLRKKVYL